MSRLGPKLGAIDEARRQPLDDPIDDVVLILVAIATAGLPGYWVRADRQSMASSKLELFVMVAVQVWALRCLKDVPLLAFCAGQAIALVLWMLPRSFARRPLDLEPAELSAPTRRSLRELQFSLNALLSATATLCVAFAAMRFLSPRELPLAGLGIGSAVVFHGVALVVWVYRPFWGQLAAIAAVYFFCSAAFVPLIRQFEGGLALWLIGVQAQIVALLQMTRPREPKPPRTS